MISRSGCVVFQRAHLLFDLVIRRCLLKCHDEAKKRGDRLIKVEKNLLDFDFGKEKLTVIVQGARFTHYGVGFVVVFS